MKTLRWPWFRLVLVLGVAAVSLNFAVSWGQSATKVDEAMQHRAPAGGARHLNARSAEAAAPTRSLSATPSAGARCRRG